MASAVLVCTALAGVAELSGSAQTNLVEELRDLRERMQALEHRLGVEPSVAPEAEHEHAHAGDTYLDISLDALVNAGWSSTPEVEAIQRGGHDPAQRGFSLRNAELALEGGVDPYWKGHASVVLLMEPDEETTVELEEAYALTTGLPAGLQVKAGRFFSEFGRQNAQHPHAWSFVDQPYVLNRMFGEDGMKQNGARLSWRAPTPHFMEAAIAVLNGQGESAFSFRFAGEAGEDGVERLYGRATTGRELEGLDDFLYVPRASTAFDLTDAQTLILGASAAFGPNSTGEDTRSVVYGLDALWKWTPADANGGWPFVSWQSEVLARDFEAGEDVAAGLPAETLHDEGLYSQVTWGFVRCWTVGLRGEVVTGEDSASAEIDAERPTDKRVSPAVTWYPSEFSKLRLQYSRAWLEDADDEDAVWAQLEFLLGAHQEHED